MTASPGPVPSAIRAELARRGHSQADAAAQLRLSRQTMSMRLTGRAPFRVGEVYALAAWLDVPVSVLMDEPAVPSPTDGAPRRHAPAQPIPA